MAQFTTAGAVDSASPMKSVWRRFGGIDPLGLRRRIAPAIEKVGYKNRIRKSRLKNGRRNRPTATKLPNVIQIAQIRESVTIGLRRTDRLGNVRQTAFTE